MLTARLAGHWAFSSSTVVCRYVPGSVLMFCMGFSVAGMDDASLGCVGSTAVTADDELPCPNRNVGRTRSTQVSPLHHWHSSYRPLFALARSRLGTTVAAV